MENVKRMVESSKVPIVTFEQCLMLMRSSLTSWGDLMDMEDFLAINEDRVMNVLLQVGKSKVLKKKRVFKPTTAFTITFEPRKFEEPKIDPQAPLLKRLDKPPCRKGATCCNKKCTFIHPTGHPLAYRNNNFPTL